MSLRIAVPDLVSPSYFPLIAAVELGFFARAGFEAKLALLYPVTKTYAHLREGRLDLVGGAAHATLYAFPDWRGAKLLCALAQHMYWFLVVRSELRPKRGDLAALKGLRIGAAPGPADGLKRLLKAAGIDPEREVKLGPVPGTATGDEVSFGLLAAKALEEGKIDGFWANGMGAALAVRGGYGALVLDVRRDGPEEAKHYTFPALVASERTLRDVPGAAVAAVGAVRAAQKALQENPARATEVGRKLFPPLEAELIAELVRRDAPFYHDTISPASVEALNRFACDLGLLAAPVPYEKVVASAG